MWTIIAKLCAGVFAAIIGAGILISYRHGKAIDEIDWPLLVGLAAGGALVTALRSWRTLRKEFARLRRLREAG